MTTALQGTGTWAVEGLDECGDVEVTIVTLAEDPDADEDERFTVARRRGSDTDTFDDESFPDRESAKAYADELVTASRQEYAEQLDLWREEHAEGLDGMAEDWVNGPDRDAAATLATLISAGRAAEALAALNGLL